MCRTRPSKSKKSQPICNLPMRWKAAMELRIPHLESCGVFAMSSGAADLDLLFGIMAVQNDFVSRDASY